MYENRSTNQKDLFGETIEEEEDLIKKIDDWKFEERLSKEFEAIGFFVSDHPLNQFKEVFEDYKITDYQKFNNDDKLKDTNVAATLLKMQERKTSKGNAYAVLKLTDLLSVFELFIFSDVLEQNREILKEGNSFILTLVKSLTNDDNRFKRINVQKIASLKDLLDNPINEVTFNLKSLSELDQISKFIVKPGNTLINIKIMQNEKILNFRLENKRNLDRKTINLIRNKQISAIIS